VIAPLRRSLVAFACLGLFWGAWDAALPDVSRALALPDGVLGLVLTCSIVGALPAMRVSGRLANQAGVPLLTASVLLFAAASVLPALAGSALAMAAALAVTGAASGALDVLMNTAASEVEVTGGRHGMSLAHASYSAGLSLAALLAGLALQSGAEWRRVLVGAAVAIALLAAATRAPHLGPARPAPARQDAVAAPTSWPILALGVLGGLGFLLENGVELWSAVLLRRDLGAGPWLAALAPALFGAAAVAGRVTGHALIRALGEARLLMLAGVSAFAGTACLALAPSWQVALPAVLACGGGASLAAPTMISLAGRLAGSGSRGSAVSSVAQIGYGGLLLAPILMGGLSSAFGLRGAMLVFALFGLGFGFGGAGLVAVLRRRLPVQELT
jgi:MFS family permease